MIVDLEEEILNNVCLSTLLPHLENLVLKAIILRDFAISMAFILISLPWLALLCLEALVNNFNAICLKIHLLS